MLIYFRNAEFLFQGLEQQNIKQLMVVLNLDSLIIQVRYFP